MLSTNRAGGTARRRHPDAAPAVFPTYRLRYYRRGPYRRAVHRPVVTTGATGAPEREAEVCSTPQIKWAGAA